MTETKTTVPPPEQEDAEQRRGGDRRKKPTNPFSLYAFKGRRRTIRRQEDRRTHPYVDQYSPRFFLFCLFLLLLVVADGLLTIWHTSHGARELNPFMDSLLKLSNNTFFLVKYALSGVCVLVLAMFRHHPLTIAIMIFITVIYGAVFINHIYLYIS